MRPVLLVDDVASMRRALSLFLAVAGHACVLAESGEAALDLLRAGAPFGLLVTDQSMPGMSGCELIEEAARLRPGLPAMLLTGYGGTHGGHHGGTGGLERLRRYVPVLRKPFDRAEFVDKVKALLLPATPCASSAASSRTS